MASRGLLIAGPQSWLGGRLRGGRGGGRSRLGAESLSQRRLPGPPRPLGPAGPPDPQGQFITSEYSRDGPWAVPASAAAAINKRLPAQKPGEVSSPASQGLLSSWLHLRPWRLWLRAWTAWEDRGWRIAGEAVWTERSGILQDQQPRGACGGRRVFGVWDPSLVPAPTLRSGWFSSFGG